MATSVTEKFYSIFWANEACQEIFLLHKEQLLEKEEINMAENGKKSFYTKRFVVSNSKGRDEQVDKLFQRIKNREIDATHSLSEVGIKNFDSSKIEKYFKEKFGQGINEVSTKVDKGSLHQVKFLMEATSSLFSEKRFLKFLQKYKFVPSELSTVEELADFFEKLLKTEVSNLLTPERIAEIISSLDQIVLYYQNIYVDSLLELNNFYSDVLSDKGNFKSRIQLFDQLYEAGVLEGGKLKTYYECLSCKQDTFTANATVNAPPSKIKIKCPICTQELFYLAAYEITTEIFNHIQSKDGLLLKAICYLADRKGIVYDCNSHILGDVEADIVFYQEKSISDIVEVKMYKTDRPEDTTETNLETDLRKFLSNREKLVKNSPAFAKVQFHFVTNILQEDYYFHLRDTFRSELKSKNVSVYSPKQYRDQHFDEVE